MIRDVLTGVFIAWLSLTPEGKKMRDKAIKAVTDAYLIPKVNTEEKDKVQEEQQQ